MATSPAVHCISYLVFRDAAQGTGGPVVVQRCAAVQWCSVVQ